MNKRAARILILFLVFTASVGVFTHLMSHETTENATDLDAASLPVLYMKTADTTVNRMYGYRQEMNGVTTRENLTPLPMDRSLTLEIDAKGQKIKNVTYTVESTDGGALIENSVLKSFDEDGSYLKADFQLETAILMNQEYTLKLEVAYGNGQSAWYYTRIVQRNGVEVGDYLAYTQMFAQTCLDKTQAEALVPQLEPDETGDNSSFLNVNIHSSLDQISWGSLAPTIVQQPVQQIKDQFTIFSVQIAGRLVGKDDLGIACQRPCNGNSLLLTAGKHGRQALEVGFVQTYGTKFFLGNLLCVFCLT